MTKILVSWKTTITGVGAIAGGVVALAHALTSTPVDFNTVMAALGIISAGLMGLVAKDANVTGGSTKQ